MVEDTRQKTATSEGTMLRLALALVVGYGLVRVYWQLGHMPADLSPIGPDLVVFTGWGAVALCGTAALALVAMLAGGLGRAARPVLLGTSWAVSLALVAAGAMLLLDVVGGILPGLGIAFHPLGALSRAVCVACGILLGRATWAYQRRTGSGRALAMEPLHRTPGWAFGAAYLAVTGCLVRIVAQAWVGFGESPLSGGASLLLFEVGFVLGGTVLPLSLVHAWGRTWPRWVPGLAGRRVPRRLVLWPAVGVSSGLVVYFGLMLLQMVVERLHGRNPFPPGGGLDLPEAFFWFSVPAYLTWGAGMAVAALAYARRVPDAAPATPGR